MGDELEARAEAREDGGQAGGGAGDPARGGAEQWRRGFLDPENWHDLAERGTPRNG
ncbi:MAG TPA: hypothetical protein VFJ82_14160 [Longimicrobium sp.]|nr:hypothetical protein [Longimicrobium sp.]